MKDRLYNSIIEINIYKNKLIDDHSHNPVDAGCAAFFFESNTDSEAPAALAAFLLTNKKDRRCYLPVRRF